MYFKKVLRLKRLFKKPEVWSVIKIEWINFWKKPSWKWAAACCVRGWPLPGSCRSRVPGATGDYRSPAPPRSLGWQGVVIAKQGQRRTVRTLVLILAGLIYFITPLDFLPDFIPGIGMIDDVAVVLSIFNSIADDVHAFELYENDAPIIAKRDEDENFEG